MPFTNAGIIPLLYCRTVDHTNKKQKPLEELYLLRGANEIHICRLVF